MQNPLIRTQIPSFNHSFNMADSKKETKTKTTPGVVYLSRLPPFMKPAKIRNIFSQYGEVGRLFLQPEDVAVRKKRKKHGGSGRKLFIEGWIEFKDKRVAKAVALSLNNTTIGGKKGGYYHDDIWNIKYLPKFLWGHLSEKIAYEKATKEQRMRTEISQAKREANFYIQNVEKGKAIDAIETRKRKRDDQTPVEKRLRTFNQHQPLKNNKTEESKHAETDSTENEAGKSLSKNLLKKVFSSRGQR
ncbi:Activator of basal transcription 1 [Porites harrisoni]